ncbi:MAG: FAD-dependent monooxygenase, partial [Ilumatobacteraceae bacterium]
MRPLIIGGGPAGTAAAITLAERGVPARLIDRRDPRAPDGRVCGGLLTPRAVRLLDALGIDARPRGRSIDSID